MAAEGFAAFTLDDLAERLRCSKTTLYQLADSLYRQRKYAEAEEHFRKDLEARQRTLGDEHAETANAYRNVGVALEAQEKYAAAEPFYRKTLTIRSKALGEDHVETAKNG